MNQFTPLFTLLINSEIQKGIPIPEFQGIAGLRDAEIKMRPRTVILNTDVYIDPVTKLK